MKHENTQTAKKSLSSFFRLLSENQTIKATLDSKSNQLTNYLFSILGYKFDGSIHNANFYHYTCEAWLLSMYHELKVEMQKEILEKLKKNEQAMNIEYDYNDVIEKISHLNVDESVFLDNLELLLGTYKINDSIVKITQMKLSQLYLKKINQAKKEILSKKISARLSKKEFEELIMSIVRRGLNYTLNELNPKEEDKYSLLLNEAFEGLKGESDNVPTVEAYLQEINRRRNLSDETANKDPITPGDIELLNPYNVFYNFAISGFSDFNHDIKLFNLNSNSTLFRIKKLARTYFSSLTELGKLPISFVNSLLSNLESLRSTKAAKFLHSVYQVCGQQFEQGLVVAKQKYTNLKGWINSSYEDILHSDLIKQIANLGNISKVFVYHHVISPARDVLVFYSSNLINVVIDTKNWTTEQVSTFVDSTQKLIASILSTVEDGKKSYFGDAPLFNIHIDQEKYINIEINKNLNILENKKVKDAANDIVNKIVNMSMYEVMEASVKNTIEAKNYIISRFRKMLASEDKNKKEISSEETSDRKNVTKR